MILSVRNKKGNILIEIIIGFMIFSILVIAVFSGFDSYLKIKKRNKVKEKAINYVGILGKELKFNSTYVQLNTLEKNMEYYVDNINSDELIGKQNIIGLMSRSLPSDGEYCKLIITNISEGKLKIKITYVSNININFNYVQEIAKVEYIK